jgi:hypothetical protein
MQVKLTHRPPLEADAAKEKLQELVASWRDKLNKNKAPESWQELLQRLGVSKRELGWVFEVAGEPAKLEEIRSFLASADSAGRDGLSEVLADGVLDELLHFSRGLAEDPISARFSFSLEATKLEELYEILGQDGLSDEVEEALREFDQQVETRSRAIQGRLEWKPASQQSRVNRDVSSRKYEPGTPAWWSGRLNDAPEMLGQKLTREKAEKLVLELEMSFYRYKGVKDVPRTESPEVSLRNTYFAQGLEPRVQFGQTKGAPGVEGYLKDAPDGGPRVLEFPLKDGSFTYLMFDGHHRAAAHILLGQRTFQQATVMRLDDVEESFGLSEQDILDAIRDLHTHLYMTEAPVPR